MTFLLIVLLAAVRVSLQLRVEHTAPVLYQGLTVERRHGIDWTPVAALSGSATGRRASVMRADRMLKKRNTWQIHRPSSTLHKAPEPARTWRPSHFNVIRVPREDRGDISASEVFAGNKASHRRKKSEFGGEGVHEGLEGVRPSRPPHPIYVGMGQNALDAAFKTYFDILTTSTRNSAKIPINPVNFVGRR